jgi:hypothetical protein
VSCSRTRRASPGQCWYNLFGNAVIRRAFISNPTVLSPLPDVALHVVEAEVVGIEGADQCGLRIVPLAAAAVALGMKDQRLPAGRRDTIIEAADGSDRNR